MRWVNTSFLKLTKLEEVLIYYSFCHAIKIKRAEMVGNHQCSSVMSKFHSGQTAGHARYLRTFARKFSNIDFLLKILPLKDDELVMSEM